jgi:valyl-tRNA synthetase
MDIPKNYNSKQIENKWYNFWLENHYFESKADSDKQAYCILMPPPNVTNNLHLGHAINNTFQDILIRFKKLQGFNALWIPGTDHGGIATQQMLCKKLARDGLTKEIIRRKNFYSIMMQWKEEKRKIITDQLKKIGCACDWSREQFTMSNKLSNWVNIAFKQLFDKGLIYKDSYITNQCISCQTALSNDEVEYAEKNSKLYNIRYYLEGSKKYIIVATTRPETLLGDTAVACNPSDERYKDLIGQSVIIPFVNRKVRIIADNYVKPEFGTGMVKITPSHDKNDYEMGKRHNLEFCNVIGKDGKISNTNTEFDGTDRFQCREDIISKLKQLDMLDGVENYQNNIGECYRCKNPIETLISEQWFIKMKEINDRTLNIINNDDVKFIPNNHKSIINHWLSNDINWCISRQIWWGHQIPIWYCKECEHVNCSTTVITNCQKCESTNIQRDQDVLDTWFSSALWAFSVFENEDELNYYFPSSVLVTGSDILFFWVARMIMMTLEIKQSIPFEDVFLHGIVRDEVGIKMSKTLGNGIDPMVVIDQYSADILRFTMMFLTPKGQDTNIGLGDFKIGQTFCTKLWNSVRYLLQNIGDSKFDSNNLNFLEDISNIDKWILEKLNNTTEDVTNYLNNYDFGEAVKKLYSFTWDDFCSCYLEYAKASIDLNTTKQTTLFVISSLLRLLHPFIPFLTEELFHMIKPFFNDYSKMKSILDTEWPDKIKIEFDVEENKLFQVHKIIIKQIRSTKTDFRLSKNDLIDIFIESDDTTLINYIKNTDDSIKRMAGVKNIFYDLSNSDHDASKCIIVELNGIKIYFPVTEKYQLSFKINGIKKRIDAHDKKIKKYLNFIKNTDNMAERKLSKFNQNIKELQDSMSVLEKELVHFKSLAS